MSITLATTDRSEVTNRPDALSRFFSTCWYGFARYFVRRADIASLRELSDRELRDIGLVRSQIEDAVCGFVRLSDQGRL